MDKNKTLRITQVTPLACFILSYPVLAPYITLPTQHTVVYSTNTVIDSTNHPPTYFARLLPGDD